MILIGCGVFLFLGYSFYSAYKEEKILKEKMELVFPANKIPTWKELIKERENL